MNLKYRLHILLPLESLHPRWRFVLALLPTIMTLCFRDYFPIILNVTPAVLHYPLAILAAWFGGFWPGVISTTLCSTYGLLFLRPHLLTEPLADLPGLLRTLMFFFTSIFFVSLISALQKTVQQIMASLKMRDEFLSLISHELRTPLTALKLSTEFAHESVMDPTSEKHLTMVSQMKKHSEDLERKMNDIFDSAFIASGKLTLQKSRFAVAALMQESATQLAAPLANAKVKLSYHVPESLMVRWDFDRMKQTLNNLIEIFMQYAPNSTLQIDVLQTTEIVSIELRQDTPQSGWLPEVFEQQAAAITFSDTPGSGVGPYLCRHIIEAHGGQISIRSPDSNGHQLVADIPINA